jgi:hypothetical protein
MRLDLIPAPRLVQPAAPAPMPAPSLTGDPCRGHTPVPRWVLVACLAILTPEGEEERAPEPEPAGPRGQA